MQVRRSPAVGCALVVVFLATMALPFLSGRHHGFDADVDGGWGAWLAAASHAVPQVEAIHPREGGHCAVCHWSRTLGHTAVGLEAWQQPLVTALTTAASVASRARTRSANPKIPRGPPLHS
jgi:hypothetical protein